MGVLFLGGGGALPVGVIYFFVVKTKRSPKAAESQPGEPELAEVSLVGNQEKYQSRRLKLRSFSFIGLILGMQALMPLTHYGGEWIPGGYLRAALPALYVVLILWVPVLAVCMIVRLRDPKYKSDKNPNPARSLIFMLIPMMVMLGLVIFSRTSLALAIPPTTFRWIIYGTLTICMGSMFAGIWARGRNQSVRLSEGDPDYDYAMALAAKANVRLRGVKLSKTPITNAAATLFRTIILTDGVREKVSQEERRAIIAHEVGHLKYSHVPVYFLITLGLNVALFTAYFHGQDYMQNTYPGLSDFVRFSPLLLNMVFFFVIRLIATPLSRKNELAADRFALESVGSFTVVATALSRIHLVNGSPHTYVGMDKVVGTHPSLLKRIDALRIAATELGMEASFDPFAPLPAVDLPPVIVGV